MSKSIDLGKTMKDMIGSVEVRGPEDKSYPDLYISDVEDPKLADIPEKGECTIKYRVVSRTHREEKDGNGKKHTCCVRLEVLSITPPENHKKKNGSYGDDARKSFGEYFKDK